MSSVSCGGGVDVGDGRALNGRREDLPKGGCFGLGDIGSIVSIQKPPARVPKLLNGDVLGFGLRQVRGEGFPQSVLNAGDIGFLENLAER